MNNVSFGGCYLHSYPSRNAALRAFHKFENVKETLTKFLSVDLESWPLMRHNEMLVLTNNDARTFREACRVTQIFEKSSAFMQSYINRAKIIVHKN